jgi:hypothetical protein
MVYVLLNIPDEEQAKDFVAATIAEDAVMVVQLPPDEPNMYPAQVWGIWQKPEVFCTCVRPAGKGTAGGYRRDPDYGWWVHSACGNPTSGWASGNQWYTVLGATLLPREFQPFMSADPNPESRKVWRDLIDE